VKRLGSREVRWLSSMRCERGGRLSRPARRWLRAWVAYMDNMALGLSLVQWRVNARAVRLDSAWLMWAVREHRVIGSS
jgi:hypothetical protein